MISGIKDTVSRILYVFTGWFSAFAVFASSVGSEGLTMLLVISAALTLSSAIIFDSSVKFSAYK